MPQLEPLLDEERLRQGVAELAEKISAQFGEQPLVIVGVLTGSVIFLADLIRRLEMPLRLGLIQARSYRGTATTRGQLVIKEDLLPDVRDHHVLVLDDIFDTGHTLVEVVSRLKELGATSVHSAVLLRKIGRQEVEAEPDFAAFEIPDQFVVGYGLDYDDQYRNLPYVAALVDVPTQETPP